MDSGLREHEEIVKQYFGTIIPSNDNKFAALNTAVWSGGSFIYVPPGVQIELPLQAYFRINAENMGQFERTMILVDEGAYVHYVEGCTAPIYSSDSLHSAVVEIVVKKGGRCRYTTIQNWSNNVYNLVTKRAVAYEDATMEWVDGNLGSKLTMKYPAIWLMGERAHGEVLSIAFAGEGQHQDAGGKVVHVAPNTTSLITSKSISKDGGRAGYRGLLQVAKGATNAKSKVVCDALILDEDSRSDTYPYIEIDENEVDIGHEATVSKIGDEQLFYLMSRGLSQAEGVGDDRRRLRRADRQGAPARVRDRDEPPDPDPDGRLRWLSVPLAQQQRLESLAHANTVRHARAQLKRDLAGGSVELAEILEDSPAWTQNMKVRVLLLALPGYRPHEGRPCPHQLPDPAQQDRRRPQRPPGSRPVHIVPPLTPRRSLHGHANAVRQSGVGASHEL